MSERDNGNISDFLDWLKSNDDEPFIFVPQVTRPADVLFCRVVLDEVDIIDIWGYQKNADLERRMSARLPLQGVWHQ
jgi:hypothetical protein